MRKCTSIKKYIIMALVAMIIVTGSGFNATKVKAGDITGTEDHAKILVEYDNEDCPMLESDDWDDFDPSGKVSYQEIAQWFYNVVVGPSSYPSKKKAIAWIKKVYYAVALDNPEYASTLLEWFTDGKYGKFSSKKQVSWNWILRTAYVVSYYRGTPISIRYPFEGDASRLEKYLFGNDYDIIETTHQYWLRSYAKKNASKPIRIEALHMMRDLSREWDGFTSFE